MLIVQPATDATLRAAHINATGASPMTINTTAKIQANRMRTLSGESPVGALWPHPPAAQTHMPVSGRLLAGPRRGKFTA